MPPQPPQTSSAGRSSLRGLIAVNAVLLALLAAVTLSAHAGAQHRSRGAYTMAAGGVSNSISSAVYIVDVVNQELIAVTYDSTNRTLQGLAYRNLAADAADMTRTRTRAGS
jgi:hypothetical protein